MRFVGRGEESGGGYDDRFYVRLGKGIISYVRGWFGSTEGREEGTVGDWTS